MTDKEKVIIGKISDRNYERDENNNKVYFKITLLISELDYQKCHTFQSVELRFVEGE